LLAHQRASERKDLYRARPSTPSIILEDKILSLTMRLFPVYLILLSPSLQETVAFSPAVLFQQQQRRSLLSSSVDEFSSFADSLEEETKTTNGARPTATKTSNWQDDLDELILPKTSPGRRQLLLQQLLNANGDIRASVEKALKDRNVRIYTATLDTVPWSLAFSHTRSLSLYLFFISLFYFYID
jgi:hypothetical protein